MTTTQQERAAQWLKDKGIPIGDTLLRPTSQQTIDLMVAFSASESERADERIRSMARAFYQVLGTFYGIKGPARIMNWLHDVAAGEDRDVSELFPITPEERAKYEWRAGAVDAGRTPGMRKEWANTICGACQILDAWKAEEAWTDWDRQIRNELTEILKVLYALAAPMSDAGLVAIGDVRRSLFMSYDCAWNGYIRGLTAELEQTGAVVPINEVRTRIYKHSALLMAQIEMMRTMAATDAGGEGMKADNLFGVYCGGNPMNLPNAPQPIFWEGWTRIANFVNRRDAGGEGTGWVSVAERLPPKFEQVLVNLTPVPEGPNWYPRTNCVLAWQKRGMWFGSFVDMLTGEVKSGEFPDDIITHWQPLPAPPAEPHKCIAEIKLPAGQGFLQCPICGATTGVEPAAEPREP